MKKVIIITAIAIGFIACKNDKKETQIQKTEKEEVDNLNKEEFFTLNMVAKVKEDDNFKLLYTEDIETPFVKDQIKITKLKGSGEYQSIQFKLNDKTIKPIRIRLDLGNNKNQDTVDIKSLEFLHNKNRLFIESAELKGFFSPNKYIEFTPEIGRLKLISKEQKYYPFLISKRTFHDKMFKF